MQWPPPPRPEGPKKSRKGPLLVAAAVLALVAVGAAVFLATNDDGETAQSSATTETTETTASTTTTTEATTTTESTTTTTTAPSTTTTTAPTTTTTAAGPPRALPIARVAVPGTAANGNDACGDPTSYGAGNLTDGNAQTAWRVDGDASGEWLTIALDGPHRIRSVGLVPGYAKVDPCDGTNRFAENRRPTAVTWQFEDGTQTTQRLRDAGEMQTVSVDAQASIIRMRLDSVTGNPGRDYTAVSEIAVTGN
jgi:hypothetical protein